MRHSIQPFDLPTKYYTLAEEANLSLGLCFSSMVAGISQDRQNLQSLGPVWFVHGLVKLAYRGVVRGLPD